MKSDLKLPFEGKIVPSKARRFEPKIVFIHHFGGSKKTLAKHVRLVNDLGYDAIVFNLLYHEQTTPLKNLPITADLKFGARYVWTDQVEAILNAVSGPKILFSFSMPSSAAIAATARRQAKDILGIICEGGPFLDIVTCTWNLYSRGYRVKNCAARLGLSVLSLVYFGVGLESEARKSFSLLPQRFPILSIRGLKDDLVSNEAISKYFSLNDNAKVEEVHLENSGHLEGLKTNPGYKDLIAEFLKKITIA